MINRDEVEEDLVNCTKQLKAHAIRFRETFGRDSKASPNR